MRCTYIPDVCTNLNISLHIHTYITFPEIVFSYVNKIYRLFYSPLL